MGPAPPLLEPLVLLARPLAPSRRARLLALGAGTALAAGVLAPSAAALIAANGARDVRGFACPVGTLTDESFSDVPAGSVFDTPVRCAVTLDVARGFGQEFGPNQAVTRAQAASLAFRFLRIGEDDPFVSTAEDYFTDDDGSVHEGAINALARIDVLGGVGGGRFDPDGLMSRAQLASVVVRLSDFREDGLPAGGDQFIDDDGSVHEDAIDRLSAAAITTGTTFRTFSPGDDVTRGQAVTLLLRLGDLEVEQGREWPLPGTDNRTLPVTPAGTVQRVSPDEETAIDLTVTGLDAGRTYQLDVVDESTVVGDPSGTRPVGFVNTDGDGRADLVPEARAQIRAVDGVATAGEPKTVTAVAGADGTLEVTVDLVADSAGGDGVLVVHGQGEEGNAGGLQVDRDSDPVEPFGTSGLLEWIQSASPA